MSKTRIYTVTDGTQSPARLIKAPNVAQAIRHATKPYAADVASQEQLVALLGAGVKVEDAGAEAVES